jgi:hypothetical protein
MLGDVPDGYFRVSKTEMLRRCAMRSKNGIVFHTVWAFSRKLPMATGNSGRAAGQLRQAL